MPNNENKKFKLTERTKIVDGKILCQIMCTRDINSFHTKIKKGDLGGWVEGEHNLSQYNGSWIDRNSMVIGNQTFVSGDVFISNSTIRNIDNNELIITSCNPHYIDSSSILIKNKGEIMNSSLYNANITNYNKEPFKLNNIIINQASQITKKYEMTENFKFIDEDRTKKVFQIRALRSFGSIQKGELGGYIEDESNLSHEGNCWLDENSSVYGDVIITGKTHLYSSHILTAVDYRYITVINADILNHVVIDGCNNHITGGCYNDILIRANDITIESSNMNQLAITHNHLHIENFDNTEESQLKYENIMFKIPSDCVNIKSNDDFIFTYDLYGNMIGLIYNSFKYKNKYVPIESVQC